MMGLPAEAGHSHNRLSVAVCHKSQPGQYSLIVNPLSPVDSLVEVGGLHNLVAGDILEVDNLEA